MRSSRRVRREPGTPALVRPVDDRSPWVVRSPPRPVAQESGLAQTLLGAVGSLGMVGFAVVGGNRLFLLIAAGLAAVTLVAAIGGRAHGTRRARRSAGQLRERWRSHLGLQLQGALADAEDQRLERLVAHPGVAGLMARARGGVGLWLASPSEADWMVRLGTGSIPARRPLTCPADDDPLAETDVELTAEGRAGVARAARVGDAPVVVGWPPGSVLALDGPPDETRSVARALLAELLVHRPPGALQLSIDTTEPDVWNWLAWVPHDVARGPGGPGDDVLVSETGRVPRGVRTLLLTESRREIPAGARVLDLGTLPHDLPGAERVETWVTLDVEAAARLARSLAPRLRPGRRSPGPAGVSVFDLLGGAAPVPAAGPDLRVPLGVADDTDVWLDLREPAVGGDGPHGLLIGATGSGKSELLRSMVLGLAWRHPPEDLAFVLADWKGGAAFDDVAELPHVAGLMTNLSDDPRQVVRVAAALRAELTRRQVLLRDASAESLARLRAADPASAPPVLVVVLDEFGELLAAEPDILDTLVACGRLGRSLGVHLLLSSQRFEEGRLRGLESHLRYRICLRVASAGESQAVIGTGDAAALPAQPGWGVLSIDGDNSRFRAAHSSRFVLPAARPAPVRPLALRARAEAAPGVGETERARAVRSITGLGRAAARRVWHPPLPDSLDRPAATGAAGLGGADLGGAGRWLLPLGLADDVAGQRQPPWLLDLESCGHLGIVAGPGSGASSLLRGIITAGVESLSPRELGVVVVDFGGLDRSGLTGLPHMMCLAGPEDPDLALSALRWVAQTVEARGQWARRHGVTGPGGWRRARESGAEPSNDSGADLLVVVDGLARARDDIDDIDALLGIVAGAGLRVRVRLVVTAQRWGDVRPGLRDLLGTRWELRLTDQAESGFPRETAALLAGAPPGRVVTAEGLLAQAYLAPSALTPVAGPPARRLLPLPTLVSGRPAHELAVRAGDLAALRCDARDHLLVLGDRGSGRTHLLRRAVVAGSADPLARRVTLVDPRRGLTAFATRPGVRWTSGGADTEAAVAELLDLLQDRRLGSATAGPLARRWWNGPEHLLVVDDADLVPGGAYGGALAPLAEFVRTGPDLGFAVVAARPVTGLARNGFEPFTAALRECAGTTVLLRGDPGEGAVAGGLRARPDRPPGRCSWITEAGAVDAQVIFDHEPETALRPPDADAQAVA